MGNTYIPPNDSEMICKLDLELEKQKDTPQLLLGDTNARHSVQDINCKTPKKIGRTSEEIIIRHNAQVQNNQNSKHKNTRESSTKTKINNKNTKPKTVSGMHGKLTLPTYLTNISMTMPYLL